MAAARVYAGGCGQSWSGQPIPSWPPPPSTMLCHQPTTTAGCHKKKRGTISKYPRQASIVNICKSYLQLPLAWSTHSATPSKYARMRRVHLCREMHQSTRAALIPHFDLLGQQRPRNKVLLVFQCCAHQSRQWNIFGRFFPTAAISLDWRLHSFLKVDRWQVQKSVFLGAILYFQIRGRRYCFIFNFEQKSILLE